MKSAFKSTIIVALASACVSASSFAQTIFAVDIGKAAVTDVSPMVASTVFTMSLQADGAWSPAVTMGTTAREGARQLTTDASGTVYVTSYNNGTVYSYASSEGAWTRATVASSIGAQSITIDSQGRLYVGAANLYRLTPDATKTTWSRSGALRTGVTSNSIGLATDVSGNIYASDWDNSRIVKFTYDPDSDSFSDAEVFATGAGRCYGMAFDNAGNLYVANNISSSIQFYANTGTGLSSTVATFVTGVASVRAIAFDDDGNLYVGGGGAGTGYIYRYDNTPDGLATTATTILAGHAYSITGLDVIGGVIPEPAAWVILAGTALFIATLVSRRRRRPAGQQ